MPEFLFSLVQAVGKGSVEAEQLLSAVLKSWSLKHIMGAVVPYMPEEDRERAEAFLQENHEKLLHPFIEDKKQLAKVAQVGAAGRDSPVSNF